MDTILIAALSITTLFMVMLGIKKALERLAKHPICAICVAVSLTWLGLFTLSLLGAFEDKVLVALLMGQSVLGIFYLVEAKVPEQLTFFRLPFLLTLTSVAYWALTQQHSLQMMVFLVVIWGTFLSIFAFRDEGAKTWVKKAVECCRRW